MIIVGNADVGDIRLIFIKPQFCGLAGVSIFEDRNFLLCIRDCIACLRCIVCLRIFLVGSCGFRLPLLFSLLLPLLLPLLLSLRVLGCAARQQQYPKKGGDRDSRCTFSYCK